MLKKLQPKGSTIFYCDNGKRIEGAPSDVRGDLSGVRGDLSGVSGDLDDCEISDDDREKGIDIEDLIKAINSPEVGK